MLKVLGLDWRISLAAECWFYFRTCANWRLVIQGRLRKMFFDRFELRTGQVIAFPDVPPWQIFQEIWRRFTYTRGYSTDCSPHLVVDIGANIGFFSFYAAHRWPQAKILAFEPAPENIKWFRRNIESSNANTIFLHPVAVAGLEGQKTLFMKKEHGWHSFWRNGAESEILVETTTLGAIIAQNGCSTIDLLKLDCEGSEYEIFEGCETLLAKYVRFISMEYHEVGGHHVGELQEILHRAGFVFECFPVPGWKTGLLYARNLALEIGQR